MNWHTSMCACRFGFIIAVATLAGASLPASAFARDAGGPTHTAARAETGGGVTEAVPTPAPAVRPPNPAHTSPTPQGDPTRSARAARLDVVKSWGIQLQELDPAAARSAPFDMLVTDATSGAKGGRALTPREINQLKVKPDGSPRLLISYLSIGEAEDYRPDYFTPEYMTEDAPDWLLSENERWKGNRRIRFCEEGWQRTILGDDDGRSVYNSIEPSPLYRLIEEGFDGVYLDRVDVYSEVEDQCPDAARRMVAFVARLAAHARKKNPNFIVILQNAEELLARKEMVNVIDAVAKEDLFYGADHTERANAPAMVNETLENLKLARDAGRPVFVLDYLKDPAKRAADKAKIEAQGFIPYFGPRPLDVLWFAHASH
ncbi:MAG: endo alpha-1,4 polygalactosaminidase [Hyphomicrobiaceae bacterium]